MPAGREEREVRSSVRGKQSNSNNINEIPKHRKASWISHSEFKQVTVNSKPLLHTTVRSHMKSRPLHVQRSWFRGNGLN